MKLAFESFRFCYQKKFYVHFLAHRSVCFLACLLAFILFYTQIGCLITHPLLAMVVVVVATVAATASTTMVGSSNNNTVHFSIISSFIVAIARQKEELLVEICLKQCINTG